MALNGVAMSKARAEREYDKEGRSRVRESNRERTGDVNKQYV